MSYFDAVMALKPTAYYRLDDSGATAVDSSGYGRNATIYGSPTEGVAGLLGDGSGDTAMQFSGAAGQYIQGPDLPFGSYTLVVLAKPTTAPADAILVGASGVAVTLEGNGLAYNVYQPNGVTGMGGTISAGSNVPTNAITHIALAVTNTSSSTSTHVSVVGYINGNALNNGQPDSIGSTAAPPGYPNLPTYIAQGGFAGVLDEVAIFAGILSAAQIQQLYEASVYNTLSLGAGARIVRIASQHVGAAAAVISGGQAALIGAASRIAALAFRSIAANAVVKSSVISETVGAGATVSQTGRISIGAGGGATPVTTTILSGAAAFIVPATVTVASAAGSFIVGIGVKIASAAAFIISNRHAEDRKVKATALQRRTSVLEYRDK